MEEALKYLEKCVIEKRLLWLHENLCRIEKDKDPLNYGFKLFYEKYLGLKLGKDGIIVHKNSKRIIVR